MEKFLIKKPKVSKESTPSSSIGQSSSDFGQSSSNFDQYFKKSQFESSNLQADPGLRKKILEYKANERDDIRRAYLVKGPCQPRTHDFPQRNIGGHLRRFNPNWFDLYGNWLEYSIGKDAVFCLPCYLFKSDVGKQAGGDAFVSTGFTTWNKRKRLDTHVGDCNSVHSQALKKCLDLMNRNQHINFAFLKQSDELKRKYRIKLLASIDCIRFLLRQGLAFRGHDESEDSSNKGNFIELLNFLAKHNDTINEVFVGRIQKNLKLTSPDIQKEIVNAAAVETTNAIMADLGDNFFSILVDESRDVSSKEQMALALRYVDNRGIILERFLGIVHVTETTALSLKTSIENLLLKYDLSLSRVQGQGYDGASNMRGEFNGLKSLIMRENQAAYYSHCFAHQLQLTLVAVAKNHVDIALFFSLISNIINVVGASCKHQDLVCETQSAKLAQALDNGEFPSGHGLNQETSLKKAGDCSVP